MFDDFGVEEVNKNSELLLEMLEQNKGITQKDKGTKGVRAVVRLDRFKLKEYGYELGKRLRDY